MIFTRWGRWKELGRGLRVGIAVLVVAGFGAGDAAAGELDVPVLKKRGEERADPKAKLVVPGAARLDGNASLIPFPVQDVNALVPLLTDTFFVLPRAGGEAFVAYTMTATVAAGVATAEATGSFDRVRVASVYDAGSPEAPYGLEFVGASEGGGSAHVQLGQLRFVGDAGFTARVMYPPASRVQSMAFRCGEQPSGELKRFVCERAATIEVARAGNNEGLVDAARKLLEGAMRAKPTHLVVQARRPVEPRRFTTVYFPKPELAESDARFVEESRRREQVAREVARVIEPAVGIADVRPYEWPTEHDVIVLVGSSKPITALP